MKKFIFLLSTVLFSSIVFSQYNNRDGNRIGISGGISQTTLTTNNFITKPGIGYNGGLSVRGNYYNNWSMVYGIHYFISNFSVETTTQATTSVKKDVENSISGAQIRLLLSYNVIKNHISIDFGPVLQVNGKMSIDNNDKNNLITGTNLTAEKILDINTFNGNIYGGISAGTKVVRAVIFYQYGFSNILNNLNKDEALRASNGKEFKGNIGIIGGQIVFNL